MITFMLPLELFNIHPFQPEGLCCVSMKPEDLISHKISFQYVLFHLQVHLNKLECREKVNFFL